MNGNNNLKRNEVEAWVGKNIWERIDQAVHDEVNRIRVAAKVFMPSPMPNAISVLTDVVDLNTLSLGQNSLPFLEISRSFSLNDDQVSSEPELGTAVILARMAATAVTMAEEIYLFGGQNPNVPLPPGINVQRAASVRQGLLGMAGGAMQVNLPAGNAPGIFGEENFNAVADGINRLLAQGQPGPYALLLSPARHSDTHRSLPNTLVTPAERIKPLVPGGFHATVGLPSDRGLLVSLGGEPTSLVFSQDTITGFTQQDDQTNLYRFRVFERLQFVVRDPRALLRLEFVGIERPAPAIAPAAAAVDGELMVAEGNGRHRPRRRARA
jgi:encapsulating protein for peroxidase